MHEIMQRLAMPLNTQAGNSFLPEENIIPVIRFFRRDIPDYFGVPSGVVFLGDDTISIQSHDMGESAVHIGDFAGDSGSQV